MRSTADDLAGYLDANSVGTLAAATGWSISFGMEPASPETAITLYDTGGLEPDTDQLDVLRPSIQVRVRGSDYRAAYAKQVAIRDLLHAMPETVIEGTLYLAVTASSDILSIGRDDNDRFILTANYRVMRSPAT